MSQLPREPSGAENQTSYDKLLDALDEFLSEHDQDEISLEHLAQVTNTPIAVVLYHFPNREAAAAALTRRYAALASMEIMSNHSDLNLENWQGIVSEILERGKAFNAKYPAAQKLRFGSGQSAGVRHVILQSNWSLAEIIKRELERLYIVPTHAALLNDLVYAIVMVDALWALSVELYGRITTEMAEEAERAVTAILQLSFGNSLPRRSSEK